MSDSKHTPGPWNIYTLSRADGEYLIHTGAFDEAESIATVAGGLGRIDNDGSPFCFESAANARLIASAPDLLAALELVYANAAESPEWIRSRIGPAIARATGQA